MDKNDKQHDPKSLQKKWARTRSRLRAELGEDIFMSWFERVEIEAINGSTAHLSVPTPFLRKWLKSHYNDRLLRCCGAEFKGVRQVEFRVRQPHDSANIAAQKESGERAIDSAGLALSTSAAGLADVATGYDGIEGSPLDRRLTFEAFVVGASNRLVHAVAREVAGRRSAG